MGRWLAAIALLAGALAAAAIAVLNGGEPLPIRVAPNRTIALPLGTALALAFATGAALVAVVALTAALTRALRRWSARRRADRERAAVTRERVRAEQLLVRGDADAARTRLAGAVGAHGGDERLLELLAGAAEQSGDVGAAITAMEDARARQPDSPLVARRLSALYAAAGRWDDALALQADLVGAMRGADAEAEIARLCGLRFEAAAADADPARGLRRLLALGREHPGFAPAWVAAGDRLRERGKAVRARRVYERGAHARPAAVLLDRIAALDADAGQPERTAKTLERLRRRHPRDAGVVAALARHHLRANALDRAAAALADWPANGPAVLVLEALRGECERRRGRTDAAATHLARAAGEYLEPRMLRCRACGETRLAWSARCPRCGAWDTLDPAADVGECAPSAALMPPPSRSSPENHCVTEAPG